MKKHAKKIITALLVIAMLIPTVAMIFTSAADNSFPVELAYNNLFVFDNWANNDLSTTVIPQDTDDPYGKVETKITEGSATITLLKNADSTFGGIFTAHSGDTNEADNNANYYTIDVEPNTTYTFSYTLESTNLSSFVPYVFYFDSKNLALPTPGSTADEDGKYPALNACAVATTLNGPNSWQFTTPADTDHIQVRFTVGNSADGNTSTATISKIIICESELLAPENIFDFNEWSSNTNSNSLATGYSLGNGSADVNPSDKSIYFEATGGLFTNFTLGNSTGYYTMPVKEYTTYSVSYDLLDSTLVSAGVAIAWHESDGTFIDYHNIYAYNSNGYNYHTFDTPADAAYLQIAFGAFHGGDTAGSGTMKNIKICDTGSLFSLTKWKENTNSNSLQDGGTDPLTPEGKNNTVTFKTSTHNAHFTNYGDLSSCANYYTVDVEPNTTYTYSYNVSIASDSDNDGIPDTPKAGSYFQPWFAEFNDSNVATTASAPADGLPANCYFKAGSVSGENKYTITTGANTTKLMVVFSFHHTDPNDNASEWTFTIKDMTLCPIKTYKDITGTEHRGVFTYKHSEADSRFYGTLPKATAPDGYVFGGWYTADGERITKDTKIKYESFSVFSRFEREIDKLEIAKEPDKTTYTVGEKLDTTGLVLKATINNADGTTTTFNINSDIYCTPVYLDEVNDEYVITAHYGGKTATFKVKVLASDSAEVLINNVSKTVQVTNKEYALDATVDSFNRYTLTYYSTAYVRGIITFETGSEEFFLEPSDNGTFSSLIDGFLDNDSHTKIQSIKFTCLDNELGIFQLKSVSTELKTVPEDILYYNSIDGKYELGVNLAYGGVVSDLYYNNADDPVTARVYTTTFDDQSGSAYAVTTKNITKVDYASKLDSLNLSSEGLTATDKTPSTKVNLINTLDRGRYLQQSYYGTSERPYVAGRFNSSDWRYNPVQGGNVGEEASKVIDYEITDTYIYVKARPLEWEKWSDTHADNCNHLDSNGNPIHSAKYGNDVISDTYVEAWYTFEDGMIKVRNRKVDYSGLPEAYANQELPALYLIEPLNHFVYNDVTKENAWKNNYDAAVAAGTIKNEEEPEFWGIVESYSEMHYPDGADTDNNNIVDTFVKPQEHWAAFTASEDNDSFGVGIYSEVSSDFYYGVMPQKFSSLHDETTGDVIGNSNNLNYRHAETIDPAPEMPTSYIAPLAKMTFKSYDPTEYTYYLSAGTAEQIYTDFRSIDDKVADAELAKPKVAIPETVYMTPADGASKIGEFYVNNIMDSNNYYSVETIAESEDGMYFGLHIKNAKEFKVNITNLSSTADDIYLGKADGTGDYENTAFTFDDTDTWYADNTYGLHFATTGLEPGEKANAKWEITVTFDDGTTETYTAYTVLFAPERTVGAVAESRQVEKSENEVSSWITGANGVDSSKTSPVGKWKGDYSASGYFKQDPLVYENPPTGGTHASADDYINVSDTEKYVMQTATNGHDDSGSQSYLGLLTVDKSRYSNTNQIPNLKIGFDALRIDNGYPKNSLENYTTYYTLGTESAFIASELSDTPSGWTVHSDYDQLAEVIGENNIPFRETKIPEYNVSDIDGKYIHALTRGECYQVLVARRYALAATSVLCSVTDKSNLREAVLNGYVQSQEGYNEETYPVFAEKLQNAAIILGDPSATQTQIDNASKELVESTTTVYYALKYDNLFSTYEFSQKADHFKMVKAYETWQNDNKAVLDENATAKYQNGQIIVSSNNTAATNADVYTNFGPIDSFYSIPVTGGADYVLEYDVTTVAGAQAHVFFYDESGAEIAMPSHPTLIGGTNSMPSPNSANNEGLSNFAGAYTNGTTTAKVIVKMTAPATATKAVLRFGNTNNPVNTSTFWNVRFVKAVNFSEEVDYNPTETIYTEDLYEAYNAYETYDQLVDPERIGFTFLYWSYTFGDENTKVQTTDKALDHTSIFSNWYEHEYTIVYNANHGTSETVSSDPIKYTATATIKDGSTFTRTGYTLVGWSTAPSGTTAADYGFGNSVTRLTPVDGAKITLYAVWVANDVNVTFDNLIDLDAWNTETASKGMISNVTDVGFTLTSNEAANEGTSTSHTFSVTGGKDYKIEVDAQGTPWDVYIFFYNSDTTSGTGLNFKDSTNRFSSDGGGDADHIFTAPSNATYAVIRLDANGIKALDENGNVIKDANDNDTYTGTNTVTFENIRVYENTGISVSPVNKVVTFDGTFGELPEPTREGYTFVGWFIGDTEYTSASKVENDSTYFLTSKWKVADTSLAVDTVVLDFSTPIVINPLDNDAIFNADAGTDKKIVGLSSDGGENYNSTLKGTYGTFSLDGTEVTYEPTMTLNSAEEVYYYASLKNADSTTTTVKSKIVVVPASNVLYEETFFADSTALSGLEWTNIEASATVNQDSSPVENEVYGYDSNESGYNKFSKYSNGSAKTVTVTEKKNMSKNITFDFKGTGFDLVGACGSNTGVMIVSLKNTTTNTMVKSYVVDTYYGDSGYGDKDNSNTLYQVPILSESGLDCDNYRVQVVACWLPSMSGAIKADKAKEAEEQQKLETGSVNGMDVNIAYGTDNEALRNALAELGMDYIFDAAEVEVIWFDDNSVLNGGMGVNTPVAGDKLETAALDGLFNVVDSVRVYEPLGDDDSYYIDSEKNATYYNIIDNLVNNTGDLTGSASNFFAYVTGKLGEDDTLTISNYTSVGPKDELYLAGSETATGVTFTIKGFVKGATNVMVSLRAASGNPVAKFGTTKFPAMSSNTEMYYDITDYVNENNGVVTIQNVTPGTLLSVGSLKITSPDAATASLSTEFDLMTARAMMMAEAEEVQPNAPIVPEEPEVPENPEEPNEPEEPTAPEDPAEECWLIRIFRWIFKAFVKVFNILKGFLAI